MGGDDEAIVVNSERLDCPDIPTAEHLATCRRCREIARATTLDVPFFPAAVVPIPAPTGDNAFARFKDLQPGVQINRYRIQRRLGSGGMGVIYLAFDPELNRSVALKLFNGAVRSLSETSNERLMLEARAMAQLQHPNVVAIYETGLFEGTVFLAMQYVDGRTLRDWARESPRTWSEWRDVMMEAGKGLAAAHRKGMVHLDFKPDNVLVAKDGHVFVTDFGLARRAEEEDPLLAGAGTVGYMAPEQILKKKLDPRTDTFSFCATFYEGLFGEKPFKTKDAPAYLELVKAGVREFDDKGVPAWLVGSVLRGLKSDPEERHPSMEALLETGPKVLAHLGSSALELFRHEQGQEKLDQVFAKMQGKWPGLAPDLFKDDQAWVDLHAACDFFNSMREESGDPFFTRRAGQRLATREGIGVLYDVLKLFGNPRLAYRKILELGPKYNQAGSFEQVGVSRGTISFTYTSYVSEVTDVFCQIRKGQFESIPTLWGLPLAKVEESSCQLKGGKCCLYSVTWTEPRPFYDRAMVMPTLVVACHLLGLGLMHAGKLDPILLAAGSTSFLAAAAGRMAWLRRRERRETESDS